jgi:dipeptidyl aminopeptidase/acylaminoacyl peptidase
MKLRKHIVIGVLLLLTWTPVVMPGEGTSWRKPRQQILDVLHAEDLPTARLSPTGEVLALMKVLRYPPLADLAQPTLRLAGVRINPRTNGRHAQYTYMGVTLLRVADGREAKLSLPTESRVIDWLWSADGKRFAFLNQASDSIELWVGQTASGQISRIKGLRVNPVLRSEVAWMPDQRTLLVKRIPTGRGAPPEKPSAPPGPKIQNSSGGSATSTYEARDLLTSLYDETLFEHYALSQLVLVDAESGQITPLGKPGILANVQPSPGGRLILVERLHKPWSYQYAWYRFPRDVEIWDVEGKRVHVAARLPLADQVPIHGEPEGPREHKWRSTEPATLVWFEALDGGDPGRKVTHRDRLMMQKAPFQEEAHEIYRAPHRISGLWWGERDGLLMVRERERERRWKHVWVLNADNPSSAPLHLIDQSTNDRYNDPGYPVQRQLPTGAWVVVQDGSDVFLSGQGASPQGDRPFLDRLSLATLKSERLFRCDDTVHEYFTRWLNLGEKTFLTHRQSPTETPNYFIRSLKGKLEDAEAGEAEWESDLRPLTSFRDPTPQLRGITQKIVTYERADGTPLSFTLFLPPGYQEGRRLPTVFNAYPREYSDPETAGQVKGSEKQFLRLMGTTSLFFLLDGYAVLQNVTMPVIGHPDTAYDTFIEQLVASAEAAIDKAVEMGVTDRERVGIMGHSHGGLMTATLLPHSDIFRAGIARSGAYNHTMRPFGFQNERRTLWQAMDTYIRLSPVMHANKINEPLLLIHGQADQNPGTVPLQSEKLYEAVRGTGGTVRLLMLPHEQHGYRSREAVEQVLAEQLDWFERHVKNAPPRQQ